MHCAYSAQALHYISEHLGVPTIEEWIIFAVSSDDMAKNTRGDTVFAETDSNGGETHPWKTVVW